MDYVILAGLVVFCMVMSIRAIFTPIEAGTHKISVSHFFWLLCLYGTICIGFSLLYLLFELKDVNVILDHGIRIGGGFVNKFETSLYFSAMTMFSVGYGELIPIGAGRFIATVQAFLGYTLPAAFFVRTVIDIEHIQK